MSKNCIVFIEEDDPFYIEDDHGFPLRFKNYEEAKKRSEKEAKKYPGKNIVIYAPIAVSIAPVGQVTTMIKKPNKKEDWI